MTHPAARLILRLVLLQLGVVSVTAIVIAAFAQRLLLLDDVVAESTRATFAWITLVVGVYITVVTFVLTRRARPTLNALARGEKVIEPRGILRLYALPARLVLFDVAGALVASVVTVLKPFRPESNDLYTQVELAMLAMTFVSVSALPLYVMGRASVSRVLEQTPTWATREAIDLLESRQHDVHRLRWRVLASVAAPVAFVALGASLLVQAHIRAFDTSSRESDAAELARGSFEPLNPTAAGRVNAITEARERGFSVSLESTAESFNITRHPAETEMTVPLEDGHAVIRFVPARVSPRVGLFMIMALVAVAVAGALGARIGMAYAGDISLATRELRATGAIDVIRGTRIRRDARFQAVFDLMHAIDQLGSIFREFAEAQERAIEARQATERMRGLFLASMSHDLKAPLNSILGFAELVSRGELNEGQRENVTIIEQRGRELLHLIDTILDAARAEAGALSIAPEWTRVGDVVMPAVLDARDLTQGAEVQIVGEIQPGVPRILVDPMRSTQALTAVILVAVRFAGERGTVHVRATLPAAGERIRIDVETTGRGAPPEERDRVFEAFRHADRARRHGSLGLGPSLARSIVEMHGGSVDVGTTEGEGTVFHVWLPTERMSQQMRAARSSSIPPRPG